MKKRSITSIIVFLVALTAPCPDGLSQTQTRIYTSHERKQDEKEQREPSKTERRLTDEQADSLAFEKALNAIKQLNFVLEADYISSARMGTTYVDNGTNFVSVSDDRAVVQISPRSDIGGLNGVGGITLEGTASNIVMKTDKKRERDGKPKRTRSGHLGLNTHCYTPRQQSGNGNRKPELQFERHHFGRPSVAKRRIQRL